MCKSTGMSFGGNMGTLIVVAGSLGCTTWHSPSKMPSANIRTLLIIVSFDVERLTST